MSDLPVGDLQFWIVTGVVAAVIGLGLWRVVRGVRRGRKREKSVSLTIERKKRE